MIFGRFRCAEPNPAVDGTFQRLHHAEATAKVVVTGSVFVTETHLAENVVARRRRKWRRRWLVRKRRQWRSWWRGEKKKQHERR